MEDTLALDQPLLQRVAMKIRLSTLTDEATKAYVAHRMAIAGNRETIFTDGALKLIYEYSDGFPRKINVLCDNALFQGFLMRQRVIDESIVKEMADDLGFDARMSAHADIPSMDIPADWTPDGVQAEDIIPAELLKQAQENQPVPEIPPDLSQKQPEAQDTQISSDDLDIKLEEFFEDTFKDS